MNERAETKEFVNQLRRVLQWAVISLAISGFYALASLVFLWSLTQFDPFIIMRFVLGAASMLAIGFFTILTFWDH